MKKLLSTMTILMALLAIPFVAAVKAGSATCFEANLTGDQEVPAIDTEATGYAFFTLYYETTGGGDLVAKLAYQFTTEGLADRTAVHIHQAPRGQSGPVIVPLTFDEEPDPVTISDAVIHAMLDGNTYINIHTMAHGGGEIRGQLTRLESCE